MKKEISINNLDEMKVGDFVQLTKFDKEGHSYIGIISCVSDFEGLRSIDVTYLKTEDKDSDVCISSCAINRYNYLFNAVKIENPELTSRRKLLLDQLDLEIHKSQFKTKSLQRLASELKEHFFDHYGVKQC